MENDSLINLNEYFKELYNFFWMLESYSKSFSKQERETFIRLKKIAKNYLPSETIVRIKDATNTD